MDNNNENALVECANDFHKFCTYIKVKSPVNGLTTLGLYDFQKDYINIIDDPTNRLILAKKFRQGGFSIITSTYLLWKAMFHEKRVLLVSNRDSDACCLNGIIKNIIAYLPEWMNEYLTLTKCNDHELIFESGGSMRFTGSLQFGKSNIFDYLMFDEPAFWKDAGKAWKAHFPCLHHEGRAIVVSTPNRVEGWFYEMWCKIQTQPQIKQFWKAVEYSYKDHPDYNNKEWTDKVKKNLSQEEWTREALGKFVDLEHSKDDPPMHKTKNKDNVLNLNDSQNVKEALNEITASHRRKEQEHYKISDSNQKRMQEAKKKALENQNAVEKLKAAETQKSIDKQNCRNAEVIKNMINKADVNKDASDKHRKKEAICAAVINEKCDKNYPEPKLCFNSMDKMLGILGEVPNLRPKGYQRTPAMSVESGVHEDTIALAGICDNDPEPINVHPPDSKLLHPKFSKDAPIGTPKDLLEFWGGRENKYGPSVHWAKVVDKLKQDKLKLENRVSLYCDEPKLLFNAGVISKKEFEEMGKLEHTHVDLQILDTLMKDEELPEMELMFFNGQLCINEVPMLIREDDLRDLYNGYAAFNGCREAKKVVVSTIKELLMTLFRKE